MHARDGSIVFAGGDLATFLACRHSSELDVAVATGRIPKPTRHDPFLDILRSRGAEHERRYVESFRAAGLDVLDLDDGGGQEDGPVRTLAAMRSGVSVIVQGALRSATWFGRCDVLVRVDRPSALGAWSYEVHDTKLAHDARPGAILQLAAYSGLLAEAQRLPPELIHLVVPGAPFTIHTFRLAEFAAYVAFVRRNLEASVAVALAGPPGEVSYPEPVAHCDVCRWWSRCDARRRGDDHLSLVAGISKLQSRELSAVGISTLSALATTALPLVFSRGSEESYRRVREQARVQLEGRITGRPTIEVLPVREGQGLTRLPAPSAEDVFLDFEGDPFARDGGREYLTGLVVPGSDGYRAWWAVDDAQERVAFEGLVDVLMAAWARDPSMHVYHYAQYEPAAMKRLMGRYGTRADELDRMLRGGLFVDLHSVTRNAVRASVERYSLKDLEAFHGFVRELDLQSASKALRAVERALELGDLDSVTPDLRAAVEAYNRDDCLSTRSLRDWLERLRTEIVAGGIDVPRPPPVESAPPRDVGARDQRRRDLAEALRAGVPDAPEARDEAQQARWILSHLLEWHRREDKVTWWEYFRLADIPEEDMVDERAALGGLTFDERVGGTAKCPIDRYRYPLQDTQIEVADELRATGGDSIGSVVDIDYGARTVEIKKRSAVSDVHPAGVFAFERVDIKVLAGAIERLAVDVIEHGMGASGRFPTARRLLLRTPPSLPEGELSAAPAVDAVALGRRLVSGLRHTVLPIQGPPGAGKTHTGARMIVEAVRLGLRVGVAAGSHKVIRNLLASVVDVAIEERVPLRCAEKVTPGSKEDGPVLQIEEGERLRRMFDDGEVSVVGGTPWLWASEEWEGAVDVIFIDEAGQLSLANALAVAQAAHGVVLLGDPRQLEQPQKASHPDGTDVSVLQYLIGEHATVPADRGLFLAETWRLAPAICTFTSDAFYEGRLRSRGGLEAQSLVGGGPFGGAGLWYAPVAHGGNQSSSPEEVVVVERIVTELLAPGSAWRDAPGVVRQLTPADVLIVAPYNAHVTLLSQQLAALGVRVGTVDKFQGQEAPVVIYSTATSSPEDAPRGMEFLYSLNRLNVATSRARCACIMVASPRLFEAECRTVRQMRLASAFCRYLELAHVVDVGKLGRVTDDG